MNTLIKPIITERSLSQAKLGLYTFGVNVLATKETIKKDIEKHFNVHVESVKTIKLTTKTKRVGKLFRTRFGKEWKKALVKVKKGEKIELFDTAE